MQLATAIAPVPEDRQATIRRLNDRLRRLHLGGRVVVTPGIRALGLRGVREVLKAVAAFDRFDADNDPHAEHDFGSVTVAGQVVLWKIDPYDLDLSCLSADPADPAVTCRVMTLMLAEEY